MERKRMKKMLIVFLVCLFAGVSSADVKRFSVTVDGSPAIGSQDAKVTIVEFMDYQCKQCVAAAQTMERIEKEFGDKVRIVIKFYPHKYHDYSRISAEAALAAYDQGKFSDMHRILFNKSPKLDRESLISYAGAAGLDVARFTRSIDSKKNDRRIERDLKLALSLDVFKTPTLFINGRKSVGNVPYEILKKIVVEELHR
jgi:protein-disulfide isomerase